MKKTILLSLKVAAVGTAVTIAGLAIARRRASNLNIEVKLGPKDLG